MVPKPPKDWSMSSCIWYGLREARAVLTSTATRTWVICPQPQQSRENPRFCQVGGTPFLPSNCGTRLTAQTARPHQPKARAKQLLKNMSLKVPALLPLLKNRNPSSRARLIHATTKATQAFLGQALGGLRFSFSK